EDVYRRDPRRHGEERRGVAGRSRRKTPSTGNEDPAARRPADHPARPGNADVWPAAVARQPRDRRSRKPVRDVHERATVRVPRALRTAARRRREVRVLEPGAWPPWRSTLVSRGKVV